jgi:hypothetical protein
MGSVSLQLLKRTSQPGERRCHSRGSAHSSTHDVRAIHVPQRAKMDFAIKITLLGRNTRNHAEKNACWLLIFVKTRPDAHSSWHTNSECRFLQSSHWLWRWWCTSHSRERRDFVQRKIGQSIGHFCIRTTLCCVRLFENYKGLTVSDRMTLLAICTTLHYHAAPFTHKQ